MLGDLKYAIRQLSRSPGFSTVAVMSLALGIGVNLTMFGFVRGLVLRPLMRDRSERLVSIYTGSRSANRNFRYFSYPEYLAIDSTRSAFSSAAAVTYVDCVMGRSGNYQRGLAGLVSSHYFQLMRAQPFQGRLFSEEELRPNAEIPVVVVGYGLWQRLGAPSDLLGGRLEINSRSYSVIGILPATGANIGIIGPEIWLPVGVAREFLGDSKTGGNPLDANSFHFSVIASFQTGVNQANAQSRLGGLNRQLNAPPLGDPKFTRELVLGPPPHFTFGNQGPDNESFLIPFALIGASLAIAVLLVASLNLANMLLARGMARRKEVALRLSLGATRWRIIRQLMIENLLLALAGGCIGFILSHASGIYFERLSVEDFTATRYDLSNHYSMDVWDMSAAAILVIAAAMLFGFVPALRAARADLVEDLKQQPGEPAVSGRWNRFFSPRHCLMMGQIALSFMLLFSAGLFVRGAHNAIGRDPGFQTTGEWVINIDYVDPTLTSGPIARHEQAIADRAAGIPGVSGAAIAGGIPFNFDSDHRRIYPARDASAAFQSNEKANAAAQWSILTTVSRSYFSTLGIPLLAGRDFSEAESKRNTNHSVAIIDESLAQALFGERAPLGRYIALSAGAAAAPDASRQIEVIGIFHSPHEDVFESNAPYRIYVPLGPWMARNFYLHVKIADPAGAPPILDQLRKEIASIDPQTPILRTQPLGDFVDKNPNLLLLRLAGIVFGAAGLIALALAVIGVYGVKAHAVARRTREIGIRIALGARPSEVLSLILRQGVLQAAVGLTVGCILAVSAGRLSAGMLYHVSPLDPLALCGAAVILGGTAILACYLPARRAANVDPAITLRAE